MVREYLQEGQRLKEAREKLGLTRMELAEKMKPKKPSNDTSKDRPVQARSIQEWENGTNLPNGRSLKKYAELNISPSWILTGQGSPLINDQVDTLLPICELRFFRDKDQTEFEEISKHTKLNFPEHTFAYRVEDDAMAATYPKGLSIFVEPFHEQMPLEGHLLFWAHNHPSIRKVQPLIGNGIHLSCESPSIPDEVIKPDEFDHTTVIGRIIGHIDGYEKLQS